MLHALIMAGGGGTRFWPRSRAQRPKQFLAFTGDRSLLQQTLDRLEALAPAEHTWVITSAGYVEETARQLPSLAKERIIGEPCGRDTAPCIALGASLIAARDPEAIMVVTPADHVIEPAQEFRRAVHVAAQMAEEHPAALITCGIAPTFPATGYGYIHRGGETARRQGLGVCRIQGFREKPAADVAERYVVSGEYLWNSGIFVWKAAAVLAALREQRPALFDAVQRITAAWDSPERESVLKKEYDGIQRISIDYAVMEQAKEGLVIPAPFQWDDVGSWLALERRHPQDADGNTILAAHSGVRTKNCLIVGDGQHLIGTVGVENLLIVQDEQAILVADKREEGAIKLLVEQLKKQGLERFL